jgi:hypothetical protein
MARLMLIAVDADTGQVHEPFIQDQADPDKFVPAAPPRVIGILDSDYFDSFVQTAFNVGKAQQVRRANTHKEPHQNGQPKYTAIVINTHNSPGCTYVVINGWPYCY